MDEAERQRAAERRREAVCSPFMRISRFPVDVARELLDAGYYRVDQLAGRSPESLLTEIAARNKAKLPAHFLPSETCERASNIRFVLPVLCGVSSLKRASASVWCDNVHVHTSGMVRRSGVGGCNMSSTYPPSFSDHISLFSCFFAGILSLMTLQVWLCTAACSRVSVRLACSSPATEPAARMCLRML